jgi:hypothetical protein
MIGCGRYSTPRPNFDGAWLKSVSSQRMQKMTDPNETTAQQASERFIKMMFDAAREARLADLKRELDDLKKAISWDSSHRDHGPNGRWAVVKNLARLVHELERSESNAR